MARVSLLVLVLITLAANHSIAQRCNNTSVGLTPLNDLGTGFFQGQQGGLYPNGENERPAEHNAAG